MEEFIAALKDEATKQNVGTVDGEFDLILTAACSACCDKSEGGNGTCPPVKLPAEAV